MRTKRYCGESFYAEMRSKMNLTDRWYVDRKKERQCQRRKKRGQIRGEMKANTEMDE